MIRKTLVRKILPALRSFIYSRGFRPKKTSILYSNPLAISYAFRKYGKSLGHLRKK